MWSKALNIYKLMKKYLWRRSSGNRGIREYRMKLEHENVYETLPKCQEIRQEKKWQCNFVLCHLLYPSPNFHFYVQSSLKFFGEKTKSSEMCYSASGSNQSYKHPASCLECVNRGKMIFCFCCCYYLVSSNNVNSVMSPITSGMHHIAFPPLNVPWGKSLALQSTHSPH